ncbi:response regulator, partial [Sphingopyxis sp.]|uniref:response regulator n=1 Tax=Sphingopyxis sp. TaxID=1908224 RepID=UPI002ED7CA00
LIERSIPFDLGGDAAIEYLPDGLEADFTLPSRFVALRQAEAAFTNEELPMVDRHDNLDLKGKTALIVEDQLLIAIDLEQILEDVGVTVLNTLTSSRDALDFLAGSLPDFAILDINLGQGTSEPVARLLASRGTPFLFATGYGDDGAIPDDLSAAPVVRKPFERDALLDRLRLVLG